MDRDVLSLSQEMFRYIF